MSILKASSLSGETVWERKPKLSSPPLVQESQKKYNDVITKFNAFFKARTNLISERACKMENLSNNISALYELAERVNTDS